MITEHARGHSSSPPLGRRNRQSCQASSTSEDGKVARRQELPTLQVPHLPTNQQKQLEQQLFDQVVDIVRSTAVTPETKLSDTTRLNLYAMYKRATDGSLQGDGEEDEADSEPCARPVRPSVLNVVARAKWDAWAECSEAIMSRSEARMEYARLASEQNNDAGNQCAILLEQYQANIREVKESQVELKDDSDRNMSREGVSGDEFEDALEELPMLSLENVAPASVATLVHPNKGSTKFRSKSGDAHSEKGVTRAGYKRETRKRSKPPLSRLERLTGIKPLLPRGRLDISFSHLAFVVGQSALLLLKSVLPGASVISASKKQEEGIASLWRSDASDDDIVVGLSVRSLLDSYLYYRAFPPGSEIIVAPCITIPGMIRIMQFHNMIVVPIDILPPSSRNNAPNSDHLGVIGVDIEAIKDAVTSRTVAIMVVHPFGMICTTERDMSQLHEIATDRNLDLIEDCAECYTGTPNISRSYCGSEYSDVVFFSFGTIKTATALGGGIAIVRGEDNEGGRGVANGMRRVQSTLYTQQSNQDYLIKVFKCTLLQLISMSPVACGIVLSILKFAGVDYDKFVTCAVRGFRDTDQKTEASPGKPSIAFMAQIRKRPCLALLSLLRRRLMCSFEASRSTEDRIKRCKLLFSILSANAPRVRTLIGSVDENLYWLFPVFVRDPAQVSRTMQDHGFDAPTGASQLTCISVHCDQTKDCARAEALMRGVLYLPVTSQDVSKNDMILMVKSLDQASSTRSSPKARASLPSFVTGLGSNTFLIGLSAAFIAILVTRMEGGLATFSGLTASMSTLLTLCIASFSIATGFAYLLKVYIANDYLTLSTALSKYSLSDFGQKNCGRNNPVISMEGVKISNHEMKRSVDGVEDQSKSNQSDKNMILLTGATGFIGSLLLRELLINRKVLGVDGVVVVCRSKGTRHAEIRMARIMADPMFSFLTDEERNRLVVVIEGDVTLPDVGMSSKDIDLVCNIMRISHIFHCAASVSFTQSLQDAAESNITSSLQLQALTKRLRNKHAKFVYISTAFVHGDETGDISSPLPEELYSLHSYDPYELYRSMIETQSYASSAMRALGFPNTYTFSKCICEHLLMRNEKVDTIIIRPSIVGPAAQEPFEGWAGNKPSTLVAAACLYLKFQYNLWSFGETQVPFIPVDVVCRFILSKAFVTSESLGDPVSCTSGKKNIFKDYHSSSEDGSYQRISLSGVDDVASEESSSMSSHGMDSRAKRIFTAAWDRASPISSSFLWIEYAITITHVGSVNGHFSRLAAYFGMIFTVKLFPNYRLNLETYRVLHKHFVQFPIDSLCLILSKAGLGLNFVRNLERVRPFLDLPLLFFPFTNNSFYFESELVAPSDFDGQRYMMSCSLAADRFVRRLEQKETSKSKNGTNSIPAAFRIAGADMETKIPDIWWALSQPRGNFFIRIGGWAMIKIFRLTTDEVTIDISSILLASQKSRDQNEPCHIVLAPTHRSLFDFLVVSFVAFALPELGLQIPTIAAAQEMEQIPLLGFLARGAGAFFLKRGRGSADPTLRDQIKTAKKNLCRDKSACIEVFIEGQRSRDRRFLKPRTGFLRCLCDTSDEHNIVPITINYEATPEQAVLAKEIIGGRREKLALWNLMKWIKNAMLGNIQIGRIHLSASEALHVRAEEQGNVSNLVRTIQLRQQSAIMVSSYHIEATARALHLKHSTVRKSVVALGCHVWKAHCSQCSEKYCGHIQLPLDENELWATMLHFGHVFAPFFCRGHPLWSAWLNFSLSPDETVDFEYLMANDSVREVVEALKVAFDAADTAVSAVLNTLRSKGYSNPSEDHAYLYVKEKASASLPTLLLKAALSFEMPSENCSSSENCFDVASGAAQPLFSSNMRPEHLKREGTRCTGDASSESFGAWGYADSRFIVRVRRDGSRDVVMTGKRYNISGVPLPKLIPFLEEESQLRVNSVRTALPTLIDESFATESCLTACDFPKLCNIIGNETARVSTCPLHRARHGTGHTQEDMFLIRSEGGLENIRLPDAVIWLKNEEEAENLIRVSRNEGWCLIPFGGGTNVSHATRCPSREKEPRPILSVDMRHMNKVLHVDEENMIAHVQAGITGGDLVREMKALGYTIGHEPDSIEFSTLGGWIATKASGMKRSKYGNIEDIVKGVRIATPKGMLYQNQGGESSFGRVSTGIGLTSLALGSEGTCGIITSAMIKIFHLPECVDYEGLVFMAFEDGLNFVRDVARMSIFKPASVRLLDNEQFRLGKALSKESSGFARAKEVFLKALSTSLIGISPDKAVCATITFEGTMEEVHHQKKCIRKIARKFGGVSAGPQVGRAGYDLTFAIAYLRDFALSYHFMAESFETFVPWSKLEVLVERTKARIRIEHQERYLPGKPLISCRVTQLYDEGACVYFYFCMNYEGVPNPCRVFASIETAARKEILSCGGSVSHHHGVGKLRARFMNQVNSNTFQSAIVDLKGCIDPDNIFGVRNGMFA